jgi:hypothetical protein
VPLYTVAGYDGHFVYVGPAFYADEGGVVEHDWLRMVPFGGGDEVWVAPGDVVLSPVVQTFAPVAPVAS